jgi:hypothetical protein
MHTIVSKLKKMAVCLAVVGSLGLPLVPAGVYAVQSNPGNDSGGSSPTTSATDACGTAGSRCTSFINKYVNPFIVLLSALVGVIAVISIILAGIQYSASADDPAMVSKAKQRIFNTLIGLVAYIFLFAFLNYLIPGGIF